LAANRWYNLGENTRYILGAKTWYNFGENCWYILTRKMTDGLADDGIYSGFYSQTDDPGSYQFEIVASGQSSAGDEFNRLAGLSTVVVSASDADGDGMPDNWEDAVGLDTSVNDAGEDPDADGLINSQEYQHGADPFAWDTDADTLSDGQEVNIYGTNPTNEDTDLGGIDDGTEVGRGTNPRDPRDDKAYIVRLPMILKGFGVSSTGFNSQFSGSATGWQSHSGIWTVDSNYYSTTGLANAVSSASYTADFTNFDYQARLWRNGCDTCANHIVIRGTPTPLDGINWWNRSYVFQYTRNGSYSVWKTVAGSYTPLQGWTSISAINQGSAWNTLRVVANGSNFYFYINGTLVWSGTDSSLTSGRVGIGMYRSSTSSGDQLWVDWATLSPLDTSGLDALAITDTVSAEQQALNDAANATKGEDNRIDFAETR
jgi:hypothetical protein